MFSLIFFTIILVIAAYYIRKYNKVPKEIENIPSISGLSLAWAIIQQKHHDEVQKCFGGHDICLLSIGILNNIININNPEYAKDLLMESEDVAPKLRYKPGTAVHELYGNGLVFINGDEWRTDRKLTTPAFNNALSPLMVGETVMDLFALMQKKLNHPVDIFETMQRNTIEVLGKLAFGHNFGCLESEETPHIIKIYKFVIEAGESLTRIAFPWINKLPIEYNRKFSKAMKEFDGFIYDIIEEKRKDYNKKISDRDDILTSMLKFSEQEGINPNIKQLRDEMVNFFIAGHDTTAMALSTSLHYLAKYPEMQEKARAEVISILGNEPIIPTSDQLKEMKYISAIIKESLRIFPPIPVMTIRKLSKPTKIGPYIVPKDSLCSVNLWLIQHHPKYWENPEQYNPERFLNNEKSHPFAWIPFSAGPRNCLGQNFSLMEQRVVLSMMLLKYKWTLPEDSINKDKLLLETQFLLRPVDLKLMFTERN